MKNNLYKLITFGLIFIAALSCKDNEPVIPDPDTGKTIITDFRDFYGICWRGKYHDNLLFAKQMGYDYVMYQNGMENDPLAKDLKFYIETPQYSIYPVSRTMDLNKTYTAEQISLYEKYFAKRNNNPFPHNLATGWFSSSTTFSVEPDYQQQEVIDSLVTKIIRKARSLESKKKNFLFAGYAWDVPQLTGDFHDTLSSLGGRQRTLAFWTGGDFAYQKEGAIFNYTTYSDGHAAFYKQLFTKTRESFPEAKYIIEPWEIWGSWINLVKDRPDVNDLMPDFITQEEPGTEFATDVRNVNSGLITKEFLGSTAPNCFGEVASREIAAMAGTGGSWFNWYGRFGGSGDMPNYQNIFEVPARLQLIRRVASWDNLNQIPLSKRSWNGSVYESPTSYVSSSIIWSTHPKSGKIFAVWLKEDGIIPVPEGMKLNSIFRADNLFMESSDGLIDVEVTNEGLRLKTPATLSSGYIISFKN